MIKIPRPDQWDDDITEEADGTFSVYAGAIDDRIRGLPSKQIAREVCYAISKAFDSGIDLALESQID